MSGSPLFNVNARRGQCINRIIEQPAAATSTRTHHHAVHADSAITAAWKRFSMSSFAGFDGAPPPPLDTTEMRQLDCPLAVTGTSSSSSGRSSGGGTTSSDANSSPPITPPDNHISRPKRPTAANQSWKYISTTQQQMTSSARPIDSVFDTNHSSSSTSSAEPTQQQQLPAPTPTLSSIAQARLNYSDFDEPPAAGPDSYFSAASQRSPPLSSYGALRIKTNGSLSQSPFDSSTTSSSYHSNVVYARQPPPTPQLGMYTPRSVCLVDPSATVGDPSARRRPTTPSIMLMRGGGVRRVRGDSTQL